MSTLDFEKSIRDLEAKINELKRLVDEGDDFNLTKEITALEQKLQKQLQTTYANLSPWQKVQVARHVDRPQTSDYIKALFTDYTPLAGDRNFGEDAAIIGGLARLGDQEVMVMGHEKGRDTESRLKHNFGYPKPEGYRKAARLMEMADRFGLPVITFINTPGAYPGIEAEERGQSEAIARAIDTCLKIKVPMISVFIGEGGSGGAIAISVANELLMLEHSVYSVISPEGCASILWKEADKKETAAEALKLTSKDLVELKIIDKVIPEEVGGAHRFPDETIAQVGAALKKSLENFAGLSSDAILKTKREKYIQIGRF